MLEARKKLPSYKMRDEIVDAVRDNQVVVISGETGKLNWFKIGTDGSNLIISQKTDFIIWKQTRCNICDRCSHRVYNF